MKILVVITYYRPHTSGLTIYAERLATAWAKRGHQVTVLTSQHDRALPLEDELDGVRIVRVPVLFRLSKGVIMPAFGKTASRLLKEHDIVQLHLPQFDAAGIALRGRLSKKPVVITYHCDLHMPPGLVAFLANQAVHLMDNLAALFAHRIVTYTRDYAENSPYLRRFMPKLEVFPPPVTLPAADGEEIERFSQMNNPDGKKPVIGMAARFATEKGVEVLLSALPRLLEAYPDAMVQFAGPYQNIGGEEEYFRRLKPVLDKYQQEGKWRFLGSLNPHQMAAFYPNLDILVLPSLNSTEAFGLVQIEAMINNTPSIASNLPGVRQPVLFHQMGKVVPIGDANALAEAMIAILKQPESYRRDPKAIAARYNPDTIAAEYEKLFAEMQKSINS